MNRSGQTASETLKPIHWLFLFSGLALYVTLRLPWVGHLLMWDEAMNLCSVRSFVARGHDFYSNWFWHHPPFLSLLMLLAGPLRAGFAERAELGLVVMGMGNCIALFMLCRITFGVLPALWSVFFYAVMPAAVFFDLWLKQDPLVAPFGLLSLYAFLRGRSWLAGLFMAMGLLVKEIAVVYAISVGILWLLRPRESRRIRDLASFAAIAAILSVWWYIGFGSSLRYFFALAIDSTSRFTDAWVWARPWYYYLNKLWVDLGFFGIVLSVAGVAVIWSRYRRCRRDEYPAIVWPLAVLVPTLLLLSATRAKTVWFPVPLYPVFAALQGIGLWGIFEAARKFFLALLARWPRLGAGWPRWTIAAAALSVIVVSVSSVWGRDYEQYFYLQDGGLWWGASTSRQAAQVMNKLVKDDQKALITPMSYWQYRDKEPCPIFVYYLKDIPVIVRPYTISPDDFVGSVRKYQIDWAMVSPEGRAGQKALLDPLMRKYPLKPIFLEGACILKTDSIYEADVSPHSE